MRILGIEISGREVRICAIEEIGKIITDVTGKYKPISLENDEDSNNVILFKDSLHAAFDNYGPDFIVIKYRNPNGKGTHAPSPISFKVESLIQIYPNAKIVFVKPQSVAAFYKKNAVGFDPAYSYQKEALKYAFYYLKKQV